MIDPGSTAGDEDVGDMESPMDATREVSSGRTITRNTYAGYIIKTFQWAEGVEILMSNGETVNNTAANNVGLRKKKT